MSFLSLHVFKAKRLIVFLLMAAVLSTVLASVVRWQQRHSGSGQAAMDWITTEIPTDDLTIVNQSFDLLDANTAVASFVDTVTGDVYVTRTDDGGVTWTRHLVEAAVGHLTEDEGTSIDILDTNTIFVGYIVEPGSEVRFASSTDGGVNWTTTSIEATDVRYVFVDAADANNVTVAYSRSGGMFEAMAAVTTDGGSSFSINSVYGPDFIASVRDVQMLDANTVVVVYLAPFGVDVGINVAQSVDGGATFPAFGMIDSALSFQEHLSLAASGTSDLAVCYQNFNEDNYIATSADSGASWNPVILESGPNSNTLCSIDMVSANDIFVLYANSSGGVTLGTTSNAGSSWNYYPQFISSQSLTINALTISDLFETFKEYNGAALQTSVNGGANFDKRYVIEGIQVQYADTAFLSTGNPTIDQNVIFQAEFDVIGRDLHVINTTDGGTTWNDVVANGDNGDSLGQNVSIWATDENNVFTAYQNNENGNLVVTYSTDGGNTWSHTDAVTGVYPDHISIHSLDGTTVRIIYRDNNAGNLAFVQSTDGASTFAIPVTIVGGDPVEADIRSVDANNVYGSYYDATSGDITFVYSTDGGANWSTQFVDNDLANPDSELSLDVVDLNTVYIGAYDANTQNVYLYSSFDGGMNWFKADVDTTNVDAGMDVDIDAYDADRVFLVYRDSSNQRVRVAYTINAAFRSFVQLPDQENSMFQLERPAIHAFSADEVFATYNRAFQPVMLLSKLDNVDDWEQVIVDNSSNMGMNSDIVAPTASRVYVSYQDAANLDLWFARSLDSAATWDRIFLDDGGMNGYGTSIDAPDANTVFIADQLFGGSDNDLYVYRSADGGDNFDSVLVQGGAVVNGASSVSAETTSSLHIAYNNVSDGNVYVANSTDGGDTWSPVLIAAGSVQTANALDSRTSGVVAVVYLNGNGNPEVAVSTDNGVTWPTITEVGTSGTANQSALTLFSDSVIDVAYVDVGSDVYHARSTDGGGSWSSNETAPSLSLAIGTGIGIDTTDVNHVFIAFRDAFAADEYLAQTGDAGSNWSLTILDQDDHGDYPSVSAFDNDHIFVSGYAPGIQEFRVHRTIAAVGNSAPVLGYDNDNEIPQAQVSQSSDGSGIVTVTFRVRDDEADDVSLTDFEFSTNSGGAWTPVLDNSAALFGGWPDNAGADYPTSLSFGADNTYSFRVNTKHGDVAALNTLSSSTVRFRFKANDGSLDSSFAETEDVVLDNDDPAVDATVNLTLRPTSGDTTALVSGSFTEANPSTNAFQIAKNGGAYGNIVNGEGNTAAPATQYTTLSTWNYTTLDTLGNLGEGIDSYVANANRIYILYHDTFVQRLRLAFSDDAGDSFALSDVDTINVGSSVSVAGNGNDTVWATYYDATNGDLKLARTTDAGVNWDISVIDSIGDVGQDTSLYAMNATDLFVSYYDVTNGNLKFALSTDAGDNWTVSTVDATGDVGRATSLSTSNGTDIYISYRDITNGDVKLAVSSNGGGSFTPSVVASGGFYTSLVSPNATTVYLAYYDENTADAVFGVSTNSGSSFTFTTIDAVADVGRYIRLDSNGTSAIYAMYYDYTARIMKMARSFNGGTSFSVSYFDEFVYFGTYAIPNVLTDGTVYVPYRGDANNVVYFKKTDDAGTTYTTAVAVDDAANVGAIIAPVRFLTASTIISTYYSYNIGDYIYARSTNGGGSFSFTDIDTVGNIGGYNDLKALNSTTYMGCYRDQGIGSLRFSKTTNSGSSWTTVLVDGVGLQGRQCSIDIVDATTVYISAGADTTNDLYFYKSTDGGDTWSRTSVSLEAERARYTNVSSANNGNTVYIAYHLNSGAAVKFAKSTDAGASWSVSTIQASGLYTSMLAFGNTIYVGWINEIASDVRMAKSTDGGSSWSVSTIDAFPSVRSLETSIAGSDVNHVYFTYNDKRAGLLKMAQTADGGATWITSVVDDTENAGFTQAVDVLDNNTLGVMYQALDTNALRFANSVGQVFDGDDVISKVQITHVDDFGNVIVNENLALASSLATVRPLVPEAPTVSGLTPTSLNLVVNANASELGDVEYSIRFVSAGPTTQYVQGGGTLGGSPFFQNRTAWGAGAGVNVTGLALATQYTIDVNARNPNGDNVESAYGADVIFPQPSGGGSLPPQATLAVPQISTPHVLGTSSVQFPFTYNGSNQLGFRLLNEQGQAVVQVTNPAATSATETGFTQNTLVSGRRIAAYNNQAQGLSSAVYADVYTHVIAVTPSLVSRVQDRIRVGINETVNNLVAGDTGVQFELINTANASEIMQSPWIQGTEHLFVSTQPGQAYYVRARSRNADGVETAWSNNVLIEGEDVVSDVELIVTLSLRTAFGQIVRGDESLNPTELLYGEITLMNNGTDAAENVLLALPLPPYITYIPQTLAVDGVRQSDVADQDYGQVTSNTIAAIWPGLDFAFGHRLTFALGFDTPRLIADFIAPTQTELETDLKKRLEHVSETPLTAPDVNRDQFVGPTDTDKQLMMPTEALRETLAQAIAAAGPVLTLQASATHAHDTQPAYSNPVAAQPELIVLAPTILPPPLAPEPAPTPAEPTLTPIPGPVSSEPEVIEPTPVEPAPTPVTPTEPTPVQPLPTVDDILVATEFTPRGIGTAFVSVVSTLSNLGFEVVREQEPAIQTTLTAAAPVIVVSSVPLWGYLPYIPSLIYHFIAWFFGLFGKKKKEERLAYGVIYDAITKQPLPLAIVRVYTAEKKLVTTVVTDKLGRYDVLLPPGTYQLEVSKPQYRFPSQIVTTTVDGDYTQVYQSEKGMVIEEKVLVIPQVPLDPFNVERDWELSFGFRKAWLAVQRVGHYLATPLLLVGTASAVLLVAATPGKAANWMILLLYAALLLSQMKLKPKVQKTWGVVYDIVSNAALPLSTIQLIEPSYNKVVTSRLTDYQGRFSFLPEPGQYIVKASKPGYEQVREVVETRHRNRHPLSEQIRIDKPDQRIAGDVAMKSSVV